MQIQIRLFAAARQYAGADSLLLELPDAANVSDLRAELLTRVPELHPMSALLRFAVNADYATDDTPLTPEDEVACIPPVSGG